MDKYFLDFSSLYISVLDFRGDIPLIENDWETYPPVPWIIKCTFKKTYKDNLQSVGGRV